MTTITDIGTPRIDEPRIIKPTPDRLRWVIVLASAAGVLTLLNGVAALYVHRSTKDLIAIEARLEDLKAFEQRIADRVDIMNNGIQSRLEAMQSGLNGQIGGLHTEMTRLSAAPSGQKEAFADEVPVFSESEPAQISELAVDIEQDIQMALPVPVTKNTGRAKLTGGPATYERVQSPDGKVYYRKVR